MLPENKFFDINYPLSLDSSVLFLNLSLIIFSFGSLSYVAPEVLLRTPYNKEVDILSIGVILIYMLSGHLPFRGSIEDVVTNEIVFDLLVLNDGKRGQKQLEI